MWEGVTVVKKCDSPKEVCQLVGRCDSSQGGVKVVRNRFKLMERYDGHGEDVRGYGKV